MCIRDRPAFVERNFRVDLPDTLEIIILCFIFAAEILGELALSLIHIYMCIRDRSMDVQLARMAWA